MKLPENPYTFTPAELEAALATSFTAGLSEEEVQRRREEFGDNSLQAAEPISAWKIFFRQFQDLMVLILVAATGIALLSWMLDGAHGLPADALIIGAIIIFNAVLGFAQEFKAEKTVQALQRSTTARAKVVRAGEAHLVERVELVPGDVVILGEGDRIPADLILVEASALQVNESMLTGEAEVVHKRVGPVPDETPLGDRKCQAFSGTTVTGGTARGVVVGTGSRSELGSIAASLATTQSEPTPLELRLARLGSQIGWGVLALSVVVGGTVLALEPEWDLPTFARVLMFSVALAVAAVPEGLPAVLTISLSAGARRLAREKAVARRMSAVETLGSVSVIVTDKTGTLTHNQMTVESVFYDGREHGVSGSGYAAEGAIAEGSLEGTLRALLQVGVLANHGDLEVREGRREAIGDPVDAALLVLAEKGGLDWHAERRRPPQAEVPFSSERARVSSLREGTLYVKGSLQEVGRRSKWALLEGQRVELTEDRLAEFQAAEARYAEQALRTLALAVRPETTPGEPDEMERDLTLVGLVAMGDPVRKEVAPAVAQCRKAGVRVIMLTGDHPQTALAVGRAIGLTAERAVTGPELAKMDEAERVRAVATQDVFARVSPQTKLALVAELLRQDEVVAMTGDGVNDAPALRKVHVGIAMGSGTAVAIEASDMVLLDDNFATIVTALRGGRGVYANVQKFVAFLFSGNLGVVMAIFIGTLAAGFLHIQDGSQLLIPLTAAQILWMNLVTDGAPAVAFAVGKTSDSVMEQPPRAKDEPVMSNSLWAYVLFTGVFVAASLLVVLDLLYVGGIFTLREDTAAYARTAGFYTLVTARLFNSLNFRHLPGSLFSRDFFREFHIPGACVISWALTLAVIFWTPSQQLFGLAPLRLSSVLILTAAAALVPLPAELYKRVVGVRMLKGPHPESERRQVPA